MKELTKEEMKNLLGGTEEHTKLPDRQLPPALT